MWKSAQQHRKSGAPTAQESQGAEEAEDHPSDSREDGVSSRDAAHRRRLPGPGDLPRRLRPHPGRHRALETPSGRILLQRDSTRWDIRVLHRHLLDHPERGAR